MMQQWYKCPKCNQDILYGTNPCPHCKCSLAWAQQGPIIYLPPVGASQQQTVQPPVEAPQQQTPTQTMTTNIPFDPMQQASSPAKPNGVIVAIIIIGILFGLYGISQMIQSFSTKKADPIPASSSQATLTKSESTYRLQVRENLKIIALGMGSISEMLKAPRIGNKDWETLLVVRLAAFKVIAEDGKKIEAPASMADEQNEYIQALDHCINCVDLTVRALDTYNADYMYQANDEINLAGEHFSKLISMIE